MSIKDRKTFPWWDAIAVIGCVLFSLGLFLAAMRIITAAYENGYGLIASLLTFGTIFCMAGFVVSRFKDEQWSP